VFELAETAAVDRLIPEQTGFYEVRSGAGVRWIAVNIDARESDLSRLPPQSVRRWEALRSAGSAQRAPTAQAAAAPAPEKTSDTSRSLGYWLLLLAAVFVLLEFLLGNHYLAVRREVPG
jgi:hypothetical protein